MPLNATNFHTIMVSICDTYSLQHKQMINLRQRIEGIYQAQPRPTNKKKRKLWVSVEALARVVYNALADGKVSYDEVMAIDDAEWIRQAKEYKT
jgi:hypothetical protein